MNAPVTPPIPAYRHTPLFPLGKDKTPYRKLEVAGVRTEKVLGKDVLVVPAAAMKRLSEEAYNDINHYLRPGHLQQLFRSSTGLTVADAIRDRRLANCRKELADPSLCDQSITEIAFRWGFSESSSFSRAFRRAFGISPRQFRKQRLS